MQFALLENQRIEARPKLVAVCPICEKPVLAKCGSKKIWHWAHRNLVNCDKWWESETQWHRYWKSFYPKEWQEVVLFDEQLKERHIADVKTGYGLVLEFQHSAIKQEERLARESFYKNLVWIVDGTRLKKDFPRLLKGYQSGSFSRTEYDNVFLVRFPHEVFPLDWINRTVPVVFDFMGLDVNTTDNVRSFLWCIVPKRDNLTYVIALDRKDFVNRTLKFPSLFEYKTEQQTYNQQVKIGRAESTHYYDPKKGKFKRHVRF